MRIPNAVRGLAVATLLLSPTFAAAQCPEVEANDAKASATLCALPAANTAAWISGTSVGSTGVELDYFRVTTAAQGTPGFYRHRLIAQSSIAGHTLTIRGLTQSNGVINGASDAAPQTSSAATTPARYIQWYTTQAPADIYVRVTGGAATTAPYALDYEVTGPVAEIAGPGAVPQGSIVVSTVGQTASDTDLWVYDSARVPIALYGNDDEPAPGTTLQSSLTQTYVPGTFIVAVSTFQFGNNLRSPTTGDPNPDRFDDGNVLDFPGALFASSTSTTVTDLDMTIGGTPVTVTRAGPFDIQFVTFGVVTPVELLHFSVE